jgi:hypothetical protein
MISPEAFDKFLADLQTQIEEKDRANKEKAEVTLKAIADSYRQKVSARIATEIALAEESRRIGDDMGARHHTMLVEIYKSLFNIQNTT